MPLIHFLLVYDLRRQRLLSRKEFDDATAASQAYAELERQHWENTDLEIVLVGADSLATIKATHGNYFNGKGAVSPYLATTKA